MGKIVPRKFKISRAGPAGVAGAAELIRRQGSGANNAAAHAFAARGSGGGAGGGSKVSPPPFVANAVHFDGSNDNLLRGGDLTGAVDGDELLLSIWFNITGNDAAAQLFFRNNVGGIILTRTAGNKLRLRTRTPAPVNTWDWSSDADFDTITNPGWHHLLIAAQLDVTPVGQVYLDDAALTVTEAIAPIAGNIDWTAAEYALGSTDMESFRFDGDMTEVYVTDEYLDIDVEANRRKFIDAAGKPVDLGADGSTPTGTIPLAFFSGPTVDWHTNKGSGGGFTETGALTDAASSPSD